MARARPWPTSDDNRRMLQLSNARPYFEVGNWKNASGATTRRSQIMASCRPAPIAGPLIARDHRYRRRVDRLVQRDQPVGIVGGERVAAQVGAGAEHGALPGQHESTDILARGLLDGLAQLLDQLRVERIAPFGTLQLNRQDVFDAGDTDHAAKLS